MSVATEFAPDVYIPAKARPVRERHLSLVPVQRPLSVPARPLGQVCPEPAPLRLTRRGVAVIAMAVLALGVALLALACSSAPASRAAASVPATVTVNSGDTLWSIASRIAPHRGPEAEIADLQRVNHLSGVQLVPGQVLRTH